MFQYELNEHEGNVWDSLSKNWEAYASAMVRLNAGETLIKLK